ncbi:MAG: MBL fold metallo-hydrolase [Chloroflexota bacterium]|nr:MBL fold metallo-hydrolase [Chloroflexota bacterium]
MDLRAPLALFGVPLVVRVNLYVLESAEGLYLVDCGPFAAFSHVRALLARAFPSRRLRRVYLTHSHFDHGGAGLRCVNDGVEVWAASGERSMASAGGPTGVPQAFRYPPFVPTNWIVDGDRVPLRESCLTAIVTPGHTPGSLALYDEASGVLLCGDLLLGPLRGYAVTLLLAVLTALRQPGEEVRRHIESLSCVRRQLEGRRNVLVLPGHGAPYHLKDRPGAFARSERLLRLALMLKRPFLPFGSGRAC